MLDTALLNQLLFHWGLNPVEEASLILFPPLNEPNAQKWEISICVSFQSCSKKFYISTENTWYAVVKEVFVEYPLPQFDFERDFKHRTENWGSNPSFEQNEVLTFEEYDLKNSPAFEFLYQNKCTSAAFIALANNLKEPFGFRFELEKGNYLISCLGFDGNFIQTKNFFQQANPFHFVDYLGEIIFTPITFPINQKN